MEQTPIEIKQLRARYVSDMNIPLQVLQSPYFEDRLELMERDYGAKTKYNNLLTLISERFDGSPTKFLEEYHKIRDNIITTILNSEAYKDFISNDKFLIKDFSPICGNRNLYTNEQDDGLFISFDMKKANFQTLKYANPAIVFDADTYEDFIGKFTDLDYVKESKYTRQVIFGKLNPKRTMSLEQWITNEFAKYLIRDSRKIRVLCMEEKLTPFSLKTDEIIFKFNGNEKEFEELNLDPTVEHNGITYKVSKFKLHARQFKLATSTSILTIYEKEDYLNARRRILKAVPATYYPQVDKLLRGEKINASDRVFYYEHELCQFMYPLELLNA